MRLTIEYPGELLAGMDEQEIEMLAREAFLVRLYELGRVSSGRAAEVLGTSRRDFLMLLDQHGVTWLDDELDVSTEASRA